MTSQSYSGDVIDYHLIPEEDVKEHVTDRSDFGPTCWCQPEQNFEDVWVHNSADRREDYEEGLRKPN